MQSLLAKEVKEQNGSIVVIFVKTKKLRTATTITKISLVIMLCS